MPLQCSTLDVALQCGCFIFHRGKELHVPRLEPEWLLSRRTAAACGGCQLETLRLVGRQAGPGKRCMSAITTPCGCCAVYVGAAFKGAFLSSTLLCFKSSSHLIKASKAETLDREVAATLVQNGQCTTQESSRPRHEFQSLCDEGLLDTALHFLLSMHQRGTVPSVSMYKSLLRACSKRKALVQAKRVHALLAINGLENTPFIGDYVVSTLVKCGGLEYAVQVSHRLPRRTVVSWSALISGYTMSGRGQEALRMYKAMQQEGVKPNTYTFVSVLKACGRTADLEEGRRIHADVLKHGCDFDLLVCTCLADMYGKCGSMEDAQDVFDKLPQRDVVLWTTMLAAYTQRGQPEKGLRLYEEMLEEGVSPNDRTFVSALQACCLLAENENGVLREGQFTKVESLKTGQTLHSEAWRKGYDTNLFVVSSLVTMYGKCGDAESAQHVFDRCSHCDVVTWTAMVTALVEQGQAEKVLQLYVQMQYEGVSPDARTCVAGLQACAMIGEKHRNALPFAAPTKVDSLNMGMAMHAHAWRKGYDSDVFVGSALVSMYGKCGRTVDMQNVFDGLSQRNVVSWNALLVVYIEQGQANKAVQLYEEMQEEGVSLNARTFVNALQGCGLLAEKEDAVMFSGHLTKLESLKKGKVIHADAERKCCASDAFVGNTLVNMYGKCGSIADAQHVFDGLSHRHVVSWNAMVAAYVMKGEAEKAIQLYRQMEEQGVTPNEITLVWILQASGKSGILHTLKHIHQTLVSAGTPLSPFVESTLITAYGRCASMVDARMVFDAILQPDVVSWNALLAAYARQGNFAAIVYFYEQMGLVGVKPNGVTFLSILSGCCHAGLVDKGVEFFESMSRDHDITPGIEHYASMADLFGRAGCFTRLEHLLLTMPMQPDLALWLCVLGVCRKHGQVVLAERAFASAVSLEPKHSAAYLIMSNIYADAGLWDNAQEVKKLEQKAAAWKKPPGQSWIQHEQAVHTFLVGKDRYIQQDHLYHVLGKVTSELEDLAPAYDVDSRKSKQTLCGNL